MDPQLGHCRGYAAVQVPIPDHLDLYHLAEEVAPTDRTALETVNSRSLSMYPCAPTLAQLQLRFAAGRACHSLPSSSPYIAQVVDYIKLEIERLTKLEEYILTEIGPEDERLQVSCLFIVACRWKFPYNNKPWYCSPAPMGQPCMLRQQPVCAPTCVLPR